MECVGREYSLLGESRVSGEGVECESRKRVECESWEKVECENGERVKYKIFESRV